MRIIQPLEAGGIYHIYNRGNNGEDIFKEKKNYYYFLQKFEDHCSLIFELYCFALLKNHFHLMVKVNENVFVERKDGHGLIELNASKQLSHFFNGYAQAVNKTYNRHGKLFEEPFKRKELLDDEYITNLTYYIHFNPQLHGFVNDFKDWEFSSWHYLLNDIPGPVAKNAVYDWFGDKQLFIAAHEGNRPPFELPDDF